MLQITTPNRPDIREAGIQTLGVPVGDGRGVRVQALIHYTDGTTETREYDTVRGPRLIDHYGGVSHETMVHLVIGAKDWLREELVPPCDPAVA